MEPFCAKYVLLAKQPVMLAITFRFLLYWSGKFDKETKLYFANTGNKAVKSRALFQFPIPLANQIFENYS